MKYLSNFSRIIMAFAIVVSTILPNFILPTASTVSAAYETPYDLQITKSVADYDAEAGWIDYKIEYTNVGSGTLTDVYVTDIVPTGLTFGGIPLSNPIVGIPTQAIIPDTDPNTSDLQLIWEGITLAPNQTGTMTLRFTIDEGADLPNALNEAKVGVANTDPESGEVCEPYVTGAEGIETSGYVAALPPVVDPAYDEDLLVNKIVLPKDNNPGTCNGGTNDGNTCVTQSDCEINQCDGGYNNGGSCEAGSDCNLGNPWKAGRCEDDAAVECDSDSECGSFCVIGNRCRYDASIICDDDTDCVNGCVDQSYCLQTGYSCSSDSDCDSGYSNNICITGPTCFNNPSTSCSVDADCGAGDWCVNLIPNDATCELIEEGECEFEQEVDEDGNFIFYPGDFVTFENEVCYNVDPLPAPQKDNIYVEENYPSNLRFVSLSAGTPPFDQHIDGEKLIWRSFPIDPNSTPSCVTYQVTYEILNIEGQISTTAVVGSTNELGQNMGTGGEENAGGDALSNNADYATIGTAGRDLGIEKRISAIKVAPTTDNPNPDTIPCGGDGELACLPPESGDEVTFELTYTLYSGLPRTDIVVMDPFPFGDYVSSSPLASNDELGILDNTLVDPAYSLPNYPAPYVYWSGLTLNNPNDSDTVEFTVKMPELTCGGFDEENYAYVSIEGVPDEVIFYPITLDLDQTDDDDIPYRDPNLHYLDIHTTEEDISNNISNGVSIILAGSGGQECGVESRETDLILDSKEGDGGNLGSYAEPGDTIYPGQIIDYTFTYSNDGDGRGFVYLDDRFNEEQLQFVGIVSTGNLREATDSPVFDWWNSQEYIDNQHSALYPYFMEPWNNSGTYISDVRIDTEYNYYPNMDEEDSINYYCYERNPDFNWLMAQAVELYKQYYVGFYQTNLAAGYNKDDASVEATIQTMWEIKLWVDQNFNPGDYQTSISDCIYEGQYQYYLSEGYSLQGAALAAQGYVDDPSGAVTFFANRRSHFMSAITFMNNIHIDHVYGGAYKNYDSAESFSIESPNNYSYALRKGTSSYGPRFGIQNLSHVRINGLTSALASADNQFMHAWATPDTHTYWSLGNRHYYYRNTATYAAYNTNMKARVASKGMSDNMYRDVTKEYSVPQFLIGSIGQGYQPTPEYKGHKSVWYPELVSDIAGGYYANNTGNKKATTSTQEYWAGALVPSVYQTSGYRGEYSSIALHNLYAGTDSTNTVTYRFKVKEDITQNYVDGDPICNTAIVANNRKKNITSTRPTHGYQNGEFIFGCGEDNEQIILEGDENGVTITEIPYLANNSTSFTQAIYDEIVLLAANCTDVYGDPCVHSNDVTYVNANGELQTAGGVALPYLPTMVLSHLVGHFPFLLSHYQRLCGTRSMFNRHNEADEGNGLTNMYHNNIAVYGETIPGENNTQTTCYQLGTIPNEVSVSKISLDANNQPLNNFVPGAVVKYEITACNHDAAVINEMYVTDMIPAGLILTNNLTGQGVLSQDESIPGQVTWTIPNVSGTDIDGNPGCVTLVPEFIISPDFTGTKIVNEAEVSYLHNGSVVGDTTADDNVSEDSISVTQPPAPPAPTAPLVTIGKAVIETIEGNELGTPASDVIGSAGDILTFQLTYANNESVTAYFDLEDDYSSNLIPLSIGVAGVNNVTHVDDGDKITWSGVEVAPNSTETILLQFRIDPSASGNDLYTNDFSFSYVAVYDCHDGDTDLLNNSDIADLPFDLALRKKLDPTVISPIFSAGDDVPFMIEVFNQGIIDATDIVVTDEIPLAGSCFSFDVNKNPGWTQAGGQVNYTISSLLAGDEIQVPLRLTLSSDCQELSITNYAQISASDDDNDPNNTPPRDIDSLQDNIFTNDGDAEDDVIDESGPGNDKDNHDYAQIYLQQTFDLAITKSLITEGPYHGGDYVTYEVSVINQGTLDATNVDIIDYILTGFQFDPSYGNNTAEGWTFATGGVDAVSTIPSIPVMTGVTKEITVLLLTGYEGQQLLNIVEITEDNAGEDYGVEDTDSDPDNNPDNDPEDEDDHAEEFISLGNEMDLSLEKSVDLEASPGPYVGGSVVVFDILVANDTDIDAYSIDITDYIDSSMFLFTPNNGWTSDGMGNAIYELSFLTGNESIELPIELTINPAYTGTMLENSAEISSFDDDDNPNNESPTDTDSDPDNNPDNDDDIEDDEDTVELPFDRYDLALQKTIVSEGPYFPGDTIIFEIKVTNQGTLNANDVEITDYTPAGLILTGTGTAWTDIGTNAVYQYMSIPAGSSDRVMIEYVIDPNYTGAGETNRAEISEDNASEYGEFVEDIDSDPDDTNDDVFGDDDQLHGDGINDSDDHDPASYVVKHIYDLALIKVIDESATQMPIVPGGDVTYNIIIENQGTWTAEDVQIIDYIPTYMTLNDGDWSLNASGNATYDTLLGPILAGSGISIPITLKIDDNFNGGSLTNYSEISGDDSATSLAGFDIDSTADGSNLNDQYLNDNSTDGDGITDQDDHDPEEIFVQVYDLALEKIINTVATDMPVYPGDNVTYTMIVTNQGDLTASGITLTDYTPEGLTLNDESGNWVLVNGYPTTTVPGPIVPGASVEVDITFSIDLDFTGTSFTNISEISGDNSADYGTTDVDSIPDTDESNDPFGEDGQTDGDGGTGDADGDGIPDHLDDDDDNDGIPDTEDDDIDGDGIPNDEDTGNDEDDQDPEMVMIGQIYDLNLVKTLDTENTQMPIVPGGDVTFILTIENQGTLPASGIELTDTIPAAMTLNDTAWSMSGANAVINYSGTILPGNTGQVSITMTIDDNYMGGSLRNESEISKDDSAVYGTTDVDSSPDGDTSNDIEGENNQTDGDGVNDEDDHDWEEITVEVYDLALTKIVNTVATDVPVYPGDNVTYTMIVTNQGTLAASGVTITDYTPTGLTLNDSTWNLVGGNPTYTINDTIVPGGTREVDITFSVDIDFTGTNFTNIGEISGDNANDYGTADPDSDPDADVSNDPYGENNQLDGNGVDDEDDQDPEMLMIGQVYDLSLDKVINEELTEYPLYPGDDVTYTISVTNEGTLPGANIQVTDYTPAGLILNDSDWVLSGTNAVITLVGPILPGETMNVDITFTIDPNFTGYTFTNTAEITKDDADVYGTTDVDSTPGNESDGEDDDDDDTQVLNIDQIYDLALTKTLDDTQLPVYPGDDVTFTHTIYNQGTLPAANIQITDYTPTGLTLNDADWTQIGTNAQIVFAGPILPGQSATVEITYMINLDAYGNSITNVSEISDDDSEVYNITDSDSDPDADNTNDNYGSDNQTDGNGGNIDTDGDGIPDIYDTDDDGDGILDIDDEDDDGDGIPDTEDDDNDEDDEDPATLILSQIYDLALDKSLNTTVTQLPVYPGDSVTYTHTVANQGTVPASNIELTDTIPVGLLLNDDDWVLNGDYATSMIDGPLLPGEQVTLDISFRIASDFTGTSFVNTTEISDDNSEEFIDSEGNPLTDIDSYPDANPENDLRDETDTDGDGIVDSLDNDIDGDGIPNDQDEDDDGDGILDTEDEVLDEDDHDIEELSIGQIYDLALVKRLVTEGPFQVGSIVTFSLDVINQGTLPAADIELTDYTPFGLLLDDSDWTSVGSNAVFELEGPILPGDTQSVQISYVIVSSEGKITNTAEISGDDSSDYGVSDIDSLPDGIKGNDVFGLDNQTNGNGENDEDDSDRAVIDFTVIPKPIVGGGNSNPPIKTSSGSSSGPRSSFVPLAPVEIAIIEEIEISVPEASDQVYIEEILLKKQDIELHNSANLLESNTSHTLDLPTILPKTGA